MVAGLRDYNHDTYPGDFPWTPSSWSVFHSETKCWLRLGHTKDVALRVIETATEPGTYLLYDGYHPAYALGDVQPPFRLRGSRRVASAEGSRPAELMPQNDADASEPEQQSRAEDQGNDAVGDSLERHGERENPAEGHPGADQRREPPPQVEAPAEVDGDDAVRAGE